MSGYIGSKASVTLVDGYTQAEADAEFVQDPNGAITVSGSNVGIGTSSPTQALVVSESSTPTIQIKDGAASGTRVSGRLHIGESDTLGVSIENSTSAYNDNCAMVFKTSPPAGTITERMRIDSSGNLLVGTTDNNVADNSGISNSGFNVRSSGRVLIAEPENAGLWINRLGNDGDIAVFRKDGSTVGSLSTQYSGLNIDGAANRSGIYFSASGLTPRFNGGQADNVIDLGGAAQRFDDLYATNGSIQTSDANEKQDVAALTATEMLVAARISGLFKTFRWIDSVADKGDNARTHTGVIAQDVQAAFIAEGLDAGDYALFTSATWWETQTEVPAVDAVEVVDATYDDDGNELTAAVEAVEAADAYTRTDTYDTLDEAPDGATERTRMGIRYPELLAFVGAYNEQRFASIETRLAALEGN